MRTPLLLALGVAALALVAVLLSRGDGPAPSDATPEGAAEAPAADEDGKPHRGAMDKVKAERRTNLPTKKVKASEVAPAATDVRKQDPPAEHE